MRVNHAAINPAGRTVVLDQVVLIDRAGPSRARRQDVRERWPESIDEHDEGLASATRQLVPQRRVVDPC